MPDPASGPVGGPAERAPGDPVLAMAGVTKRYHRGGPEVLRQIDLEIGAGDLVVVAGGNGSGKSTLLRLAVSLSRPTSGRLTRRPRSVAYVPERLPTSIRMPAATYLSHLGRVRGLDPTEARRVGQRVVRSLGLAPGPEAPVPMAELSKGNRQKVALAQAFLVPVELIALDEPYSGLDPSAAVALDALIAEARARGTAVVATAHRPGAVPGASTVHQLAAGRLAPPPPEPTAGRPGTRPSSGWPPASPEPSAPEGPGGPVLVRLRLPAAEGGRPQPSDGDRTASLLLARSAVDDLLARALARGASVLEVRAMGDGGGGPRP